MIAVELPPATPQDVPAITAIYNQAVLTTTATFDTEPKKTEQMLGWFQAHDKRHPVVAAAEGETVVGWAALSEYSDRGAYADTAEIAVYVEESCRGRGVGRLLAESVIRAGREAGLHTLISRIAEDNIVSIRLTESLGFAHVGLMKEAGWKFGRRIGVVIMQLIYD